MIFVKGPILIDSIHQG